VPVPPISIPMARGSSEAGVEVAFDMRSYNEFIQLF
jgi:hypothetical protein